ncbi:hypothetical protein YASMINEVIRUS_390 [Yasminevirus sp. GU-2018]|uniref:Uncharacterized protein n=1 Tax=Yasminevirus sp. GU-2018 TaxID=2420051 RepID=A0A5K0U7Y2_9VIRU|nr:hypothetical protein YASMINEVIRUS_390 [Yasminevirus sp. GU-2018]
MADFIKNAIFGAPVDPVNYLNKQRIDLLEESSWFSSNAISYDRFLDAFEQTDKSQPLVVNIKTYGGRVTTFMPIARALSNYPQKTIAVIKRYACSGGSLLCLVCDEIVMTKDSMMGAINPYYLIPFTSRHVKKAEEALNMSWTKVLFDYVSDMEKSYVDTFKEMMLKKYSPTEIDEIIEFFLYKNDHNLGIYYDSLPECIKKRVRLVDEKGLTDAMTPTVDTSKFTQEEMLKRALISKYISNKNSQGDAKQGGPVPKFVVSPWSESSVKPDPNAHKFDITSDSGSESVSDAEDDNLSDIDETKKEPVEGK